MPGKPPYLPLYVKDLLGDCNVDLMNTLEFGAYMRLLCFAWQQEPPGSIPADDTILARVARLDATAWAECKPRVLAAFTPGRDDRYHQPRLRSEYARIMAKFKKYSEAGRRGAERRWHEKPASDGDANGDAIGDANGVSMATGSGYSSVSSTEGVKKQTHRKGGAGGKPKVEIEEAARRVVDHYKCAVADSYPRSRGVKNVSTLLRNGRTEEELKRAADGYAAKCRSMGWQPDKRKCVGNFYGQDATYEEFLTWKPQGDVKDMTPEELEAYREARKAEARKKPVSFYG